MYAAGALPQGNTTWSGLYILTSAVSINSGSTLVIQAGTTVLFNLASSFLQVFGGSLLVLGTPSLGVTFAPQPGSTGSAGYIWFYVANFNNVVMQYATFTNLPNHAIYDQDAANFAGIHYSGRRRLQQVPSYFSNTGTLAIQSCTFTNASLQLARAVIQNSVLTSSTVDFYPWCNNNVGGFQNSSSATSCSYLGTNGNSVPVIMLGTSVTGGSFNVQVPFDHGGEFDYYAANITSSTFTGVSLFFDLYFECRVGLVGVSITGAPPVNGQWSCSISGGTYGMGDGGGYPFYSRSYVDLVGGTITNCYDNGLVPWGMFTSSAVNNMYRLNTGGGPYGNYSGLPMPMAGAYNTTFNITAQSLGFGVAGTIDHCTFIGPGFGTGLTVGGATVGGTSLMNFGPNGPVSNYSQPYSVTMTNSILQGFDTLLTVLPSPGFAYTTYSQISSSNLIATGAASPLVCLAGGSSLQIGMQPTYVATANGTSMSALVSQLSASNVSVASQLLPVPLPGAGASSTLFAPPPAPPPAPPLAPGGLIYYIWTQGIRLSGFFFNTNNNPTWTTTNTFLAAFLSAAASNVGVPTSQVYLSTYSQTGTGPGCVVTLSLVVTMTSLTQAKSVAAVYTQELAGTGGIGPVVIINNLARTMVPSTDPSSWGVGFVSSANFSVVYGVPPPVGLSYAQTLPPSPPPGGSGRRHVLQAVSPSFVAVTIQFSGLGNSTAVAAAVASVVAPGSALLPTLPTLLSEEGVTNATATAPAYSAIVSVGVPVQNAATVLANLTTALASGAVTTALSGAGVRSGGIAPTPPSTVPSPPPAAPQTAAVLCYDMTASPPVACSPAFPTPTSPLPVALATGCAPTPVELRADGSFPTWN